MLILGRKVGQSVMIGDDIKVTVMHIGSKLKLEIDSPNYLKVSSLKSMPDALASKRTRKVGETILIGDWVKVSILQVETGLLRVAIDAPKEVGVFREEIYQNKDNRETNKKIQKHFIVFDYTFSKIATI